MLFWSENFSGRAVLGWNFLGLGRTVRPGLGIYNTDLFQSPFNILTFKSYKSLNPAKSRSLELAENFRQQYAHLYPTRMPLLLAPKNEALTDKARVIHFQEQAQSKKK